MTERETRNVCALALGRMHRVLDGDLMDARERQALDAHVASCDGCAEAWDGLRDLQRELRDLRLPAMPAEAFDAVLARTRGMQPAARRGRLGLDWRTAAAALLALAVLGLWSVGGNDAPRYTIAERTQAEAEARLALRVVTEALGRARQVGIERVLAGEVSPALEKVPVKLPPAPKGDSRT